MTNKLRHLLLVTLEDPYNPLSWSGIPYNMRLALEAKVEKLSILSGLKPTRNPKDVALRLLLGGKPLRYPLYLAAASQKEFARQTAAAIRQHDPDAMLVISSHCLIRLDRPDIPVFMFSDAPWISWKETYSAFEKTPLLGPRFARLEAQAARQCTGLIFTSQWAVEEAQRLYGVSADKVHAHPMGSNWNPGLTTPEIEAAIDARPDDRLDLLYVGKDWERKGGPLAIEVAAGLRDAGVAKVTLHIVGCTPEVPERARDVVKVHGRLRASDPEESRTLRRLFLESHFLIVPTRAECFGLVFAEAQAFGLPPVSRSVQALPSIVLDGQTGILEPADAPAENYVRRILPLHRNRDAYRKIARAARAHYEATLNWESFADGVVHTIEESLQSRVTV